MRSLRRKARLGVSNRTARIAPVRIDREGTDLLVKGSLVRILVVGGAGFIGRRLCGVLARRGDTVVSLDPNDDPMREWAQLSGSVTDREAIRAALGEADAQAVVNLAYLLGEEAERSPVRACDVNVVGSMILAEECVRAGVDRLLYSSSIAVYGASQERFGQREIVESDSIPMLDHTTSYAATKALVEYLSIAERTRSGLETVGLRLSVVVGHDRERGFSAWLSRLIDDARHRRGSHIPSNADLRMNLISVDDVSELFAAALHSPGRLEPLYNSGGDDVATEDIARMLGMEGDVSWGEDDDAARRGAGVHRLSAEAAARDLGFRARPIAEFLRTALA